jgi:AcrR family transcriptional regulator
MLAFVNIRWQMNAMPPRTIEKSGRTRAAIEEAARALFAEQGYERTTIREIASAAGIDPALVIRYFGSKDELFSTVAEPDLQLPDLTNVDPAEIGERLVGHFLTLWEGGSGMPILLRSAASNAAAAAKLQQIFAAQVFPVIAAVGLPRTAANRAGLVASQLLGLAMTRYILRLPQVVAMDRDYVVREVGETIQRYVNLDIPNFRAP